MKSLRVSSRWGRWLSLGAVVCVMFPIHAPMAAPAGPQAKPTLLEQAWAGPMKGIHEVIFCTRLRYNDPHWYANIGYYCDDEHAKAYAGNGKPDVGALYKLDLRTGRLEVLLDAKGGSVRDPQVHYDGRKVLFSYRPAGTDYYHLYEMNLDGTGLKQLTSGPFDDYEPTYLPDDSIVFVSTRCKRWVNCWMTQVGIMHRCDPDGSHIRPVSANTEHDNTPWMMPDGRLLYTRWEYVDRSQVEFHHLWTMNPDGSAQTIFYGNMRPGTVMIDAKPIPGTDKVVASFSPGHGVNEHAGIATIISPEYGPDDPRAVRPLHRRPLTRDPYPLSEDCFLVARGKEIVLLNGHGQMQVLYTHRGPGEVHEPRPVHRRPRERMLQPHTDPEAPVGYMVLADVYESRNLPGVERGSIKKLLVLESLPKPVNFSGGPDLTSWLGTFTLERVLGTVPVAPDGSAFFEVPANRQIFFVALDERDLSVKRMQSFTCVMPGETLGCVGCHEHRTKAPAVRPGATLMALQRPPAKIQPFEGFPDVLDFHRDVQPILDRHCVPCHNTQRREGGVLLTGDLGPQWSLSYFSLFANLQVADGRNGLGNQPPRTIGSSASPLLRKVEGGHYDVKVSPREWRTLWLWIESGAPYAGTYAALRNEQQQTRAGMAVGSVFGGQRAVLNKRCASCHGRKSQDGHILPAIPFNPDMRVSRRPQVKRPTGIHERIVFEHDPIARFSSQILLNFTHPEQSPLLLGPLAKEAGGWGSCGPVFADTSDPDYQRLLSAITQAKARLDVEPRFATPGFRPNPQYIREMKRFGILPPDFDPAKEPVDVFALDQAYWRSLWHQPRPMASR